MIDEPGADEIAFAPDQPTALDGPKAVIRYEEVYWDQWEIDIQPQADATIGNIAYSQFEKVG